MGARLLAVALGGASGALLRYGATLLTQRYLGQRFPWGTLLVNLMGCFLLGALLAWSSERSALSEPTRLFLTVGLLGAFTTFSTFGNETLELLRDGATAAALGYVGVSLVCGLGALFLGRAAALALS